MLKQIEAWRKRRIERRHLRAQYRALLNEGNAIVEGKIARRRLGLPVPSEWDARSWEILAELDALDRRIGR